MKKSQTRLCCLVIIFAAILLSNATINNASMSNAAENATKNVAETSRKILYFSNSAGYEHSTVRSQNGLPSVSDIAIADVCKPVGIEVICTKNGSIFDEDLHSYDAFVFQTSGELAKGTKEHPEWALTETGWKNLLSEIRNGKGLVGFHPTTDSNRVGGNIYENSPKDKITEFTKLLGAEFTVHGQSQETTISVVQPSPFAWLEAKGKSFRMFDEWYVHKNFGNDLRVFAVLETEGMKGEVYRRPPCPIVWGRAEGKGRVFYSAFGHYDEYWKDSNNISLVLQLIQAAIGEIKVDLTPNINTITPEAAVLKLPN
ncbi:MAG: ThuA domain-containing protein [Planctomycetaceae bacterium]|jgi:type 1 glutamine amidotransferase|nr:ThuA domain-containing protein [Planctomycetaceae bacterium]